MFNIFNLFTKEKNNDKNDEKEKQNTVKLGTGFSATESAKISTQEAAKKFWKPETYQRKFIDDGTAKRNIKKDTFNSSEIVKYPYTGNELELKKTIARQKYGDNWTEHLAEADHIRPLKQRYKDTKDNPWLTNEDIKKSSNSKDNLEVVSRKFNNAKRSRSNKEFIEDDEYLRKTGVKLSKEGKRKAIVNEKNAKETLRKKDIQTSVKNAFETTHNAGKVSAYNAGATAMTMSTIINIVAVGRGEKSVKTALKDITTDTGKAAVTGYFMGGGLTFVNHSLSSSSSSFIKALAKSNVPGNVITAVMITGDTLKRYAEGKITTRECLIELGDKGLNFATMGYSMAAGQTLIPIPIVGAAVGAMVGSMLTSSYYKKLIDELNRKELEHQERLRIIAECELAVQETKKYRQEMESYLELYFKDYQDCFNDALTTIQLSFQVGDADGVVMGANKITRKLGGKVYYDNLSEFENYLCNNSKDIL